MAESMKGLKRTARCAELTSANIGNKVTVMGWAAKARNKGGIVFVDLRDRSGLLQIIFDSSQLDEAVFEKAGKIRSEFVLAVTGTVAKRSGAVNPNLKTGEIEVVAESFRILSESETPPFPVEDNIKTKDEIRLKYRYLDLRRPELQRNLILRNRIVQTIRRFLDGEGFLEMETPCLIKSTPEGARDYLVPSRVHPGSFYALPQSPQLFKQLLMCSGYDRYFQMARCFRDEDLRADRQPEFTQVDMELSFVDIDDVLDVNTRLLQNLLESMDKAYAELDFPKEIAEGVAKAAKDIAENGIERMTWLEAMDSYGSDKPDLRFGLKIKDISDVVSSCGFSVFENAVSAGQKVRGLNLKGQGGMPRKRIDKLTETAKLYGAKGMAYLAIQEDGTVKSSFAKFLSEEGLEAIKKAMDAENGDLLVFVADKLKVVRAALGAIRLEMGEEMGLIDHNAFRFVWITEFPLLEWSDEENRFQAMHHPFTMPMEEDWENIDSDPGSVRAEAYDIVLNGTEIGGGSIRIHRDDIQSKMLEVLGFTPERAQSQFGFLLTAFKYGVPPHAGLAYGLDRLVMILTGRDSIRDVIAFPKVKDASDLMTNAPDLVDDKQLEELGIAVVAEEEQE